MIYPQMNEIVSVQKYNFVFFNKKKELNLDWLDKHQLNIATDNQCKLLDSIDKINYVDSPDANLTKENWLDLQAQIHKLHW